MELKSQRPKEWEGSVSMLSATIEALNLAKEISSIMPAKVVFGSVSIILTMIRDAMINQADYVELGLACAEVCTILDRGLRGKRLNDLNDSVRDAIDQLARAVEKIQKKIEQRGKRGLISQHFHAKNDKDEITIWRSDLDRILHVFNTELAIDTHTTVSNTHTMVSGIYRAMVKGPGGALLTQTRILGESPPPPPRTFFGRDELIEEIVDLAENFTPIALIGAGGIGKTSVALAVLHHDRIKHRFGDDRRFIRCDQFPASRAHFLRRLSDVVGAGVENPEDLTPLRRFLGSKEMVIVLDNAESILSPLGANAQEIYAVVEELGRFSNIWMCITSRISTTPPDFTRLDIPTLSADAACDTFYRIYGSGGGRSNVVNGILEQLDFHPLSITLLATVAYQNKWNTSRLAKEWERRRTSVLRTQHNMSLADAIELSLDSSMFRELGPDARELLGVVAFLPQGVNENNLDWLLPTVSNRTDIFDKFCILSLAYRNNGFITMLAPLRDYLSPKDPMLSPLLCIAKECYFARMSVGINPNGPNFRESQWITSEDVNVEHLLDVFTTIDVNSDDIWDTCANFMEHLYWHKRRLTVLKPKVEGLPDDHRSKPKCLFELSLVFPSIGNYVECKRLLTHALKLSRERGSDLWVAVMLRQLSNANLRMDLLEEGIQQAKEASDIWERLGDTVEHVNCLIGLAKLLQSDQQLDAAEGAVRRALDLISEKDDQFLVCSSHHILGDIYQSKGETERAIHHYELALGIASCFRWPNCLFWNNYSLARLLLDDGRFDDAQARIERSKSHAADNAYNLGRAMELQAEVWYRQYKDEEARSEALRAADIFEELGAATELERCRKFLQFLQCIEEELESSVAPEQSESDFRGTKIWDKLFR